MSSLFSNFLRRRSTKAAIAFLKSSPKYSQKHIDNILQLTEAEGKKLRPDKYDWQEGGESVPDGWKIRYSSLHFQ